MHFGIPEKPTTDYVSLCNNAGLISKVFKEIASEIAENCRSRQPHCRLTPLTTHQGTPANIRINLISLGSRIIGLHFAADSMGLSSFKFLWWAPEDASYLQ